MDNQQRRKLDEYLESFCQNLDIDSILPYLQSKQILFEHHIETIKVWDFYGFCTSKPLAGNSNVPFSQK